MKQQELEDTALALGGTRFQRKLRKAREQKQQSTVGAIRKLLKGGIEPIEQAIQQLLDNPKRGKRHVALRWCRMVGPDKAAFITLRTVLDALEGRALLRQTALTIAGYIVDELRFRKFEQDAPGLFKYRLSKFNTSSYHHMKRAMDAALGHAEVDTTEIDNLGTPSQRLLVGVKLIDILIQTTGLVEPETRSMPRAKGKFRSGVYLVPTEETGKWIDARNALLELRTPVALPMCVPPLPWTQTSRGGYRFALRSKHPLARSVGPRKVEQPNEMPEVYAGLNAAQATAWKVNKPVYELVTQIIERGDTLAGIAAFEPEELPVKPDDIATNDKTRLQWRKRAHVVHERNHERKIKALEVQRIVASAKRMMEFDAFWFPMNLDFRGRMYPIPAYLHPQGDDVSKALLTFADMHAKPLGQQGAAYLAIHGANVMGECPWTTKKLNMMTLKERIAWVKKHSMEIKQVANDPWSHSWWADADKPLVFYAFCHEWAQYLEHGSTYKCSLPVASDGSCNGIQHFSAMLRDPVGARAVNVTPSEKPHDLYQKVADRVMKNLTRDAIPSTSTTGQRISSKLCEHSGDNSNAELASRWLKSGLVTRKLCKRPTMTFGYGSKQFGFAYQIRKDLCTLDTDGAFLDETRGDDEVIDRTFVASTYLAGFIWDSLSDVVVAAYDAMAWMQDAGRVVLRRERKPLEWTAPTGFVVRQNYFKWEGKQITTVLNGRVCRPVAYSETDDVAVVKQVNAISPNFVHSLDAAALVRTISSAFKAGITAFAMVHDSYATVPADAVELGDWTREEFARMYEENDVIKLLHAELLVQADGFEIPDPPRPGDLDLSLVRDSDYFFA